MNIKIREVDIFNNIDNKFSIDSSLTLRKFIIDIKSEDGEIFAVAMTCNWRNFVELWVNKK